MRSGRRHLIESLPWLLIVVAFATLAWLRGSLWTVRGDEGTYIAMAESLALDGDLRFDERDRRRVEAASESGRKSLILHRTADGKEGIAYSKPVLYAVVAAPFYRLFGAAGMILWNLICLLLALGLAAAYLRRRFPEGRAGPVLATFAGLSMLPAYVAWRMSDLFQASLVLAGLVLALAATRLPTTGEAADGRSGRWSRLLRSPASPALGGVLLGLVAAARYPHLLVAVAPVVALALERRWRPAAAVASGVAFGFALALAANLLLVGTISPYRAPRTTFHPETGYPVSGSDPIALEQLEEHPATQSLGIRPRFEPRVTAYASLYFLVGRHTGLVLYFPAVLALLLAALRRPDRQTAVLLLALVGMAVFYLVWLPRNYHGGGSFVGNRYFLSAYPLLILSLNRLPGRRSLAAVWALGLAAWLSASASVATTRALADDSQNHAHAGLFRVLPYESTARLIEGRRDRYWRDDFFRFTDPWAEVAGRGGGDPTTGGFALAPGRPPAEILLATRRDGDGFLFELASEAPEVELVVRDLGGTARHSIPGGPGGSRGIVELRAAPAWRVHPFWWSDELYRARILRLAVERSDGGEAPARLTYAGDARALEEMFVRTVHAAELPRAGVAGQRTRMRLVLQNMSHILWRSRGPLEVLAGYRLLPADPAAGPVAEGRGRLTRDVPSGGVFRVDLEIEWPAEPGRYRLVVDLLVRDVAWFAERLGQPVAHGEVEVVAAEPPA